MPWLCSKRPGCGAGHGQSSWVWGRGYSRGASMAARGLGQGEGVGGTGARVFVFGCVCHVLGTPAAAAGEGTVNLHRHRSSCSIHSQCMEGGHEQHPRDPVLWALAPPVPTHPHTDSTRVVKSCPPGPSSIKEACVISGGSSMRDSLVFWGQPEKHFAALVPQPWLGVGRFYGAPEGGRWVRVFPTPCLWHGCDTSCIPPQLSFLFVLAGWSQQGDDDVGTGAAQP